MTLIKKPFENTVGKGKDAGDQHFVLSHYVFNPIKKISIFEPQISERVKNKISEQVNLSKLKKMKRQSEKDGGKGNKTSITQA